MRYGSIIFHSLPWYNVSWIGFGFWCALPSGHRVSLHGHRGSYDIISRLLSLLDHSASFVLSHEKELHGTSFPIQFEIV